MCYSLGKKYKNFEFIFFILEKLNQRKKLYGNYLLNLYDTVNWKILYVFYYNCLINY
jgi:hypothetical protein